MLQKNVVQLINTLFWKTERDKQRKKTNQEGKY